MKKNPVFPFFSPRLIFLRRMPRKVRCNRKFFLNLQSDMTAIPFLGLRFMFCLRFFL